MAFIEFVERCKENVVPSLDTALATQILLDLKTIQSQVAAVGSTVEIKQTESINRFNEFKQGYLHDIANILTVNNADKIVPTMKEYNEIFINRLTLIFKEIIPKNQENQTKEIQQFIQNLHQIKK